MEREQAMQLQARVHELERELRRKKQEHLTKWDWLEQQYSIKTNAVALLRQRLENVDDELRASEEMCTLKDRRIEELEGEFATEKQQTEVSLNTFKSELRVEHLKE